MFKQLTVLAMAVVLAATCIAGEPGGESREYERAFADGKYQEAYELATTGVGQGNALNALGYEAYKASQFDKAEAYLRRAIAADELQYWAHNTLGAILLYQGKVEEAIASFQRSVKANKTATDEGAAARIRKAEDNIKTAKLYL